MGRGTKKLKCLPLYFMKYKNSLLLKITLTLGVALIVVLLFWRLTEYNFKKISEPVRKLSDPYPPLALVNTIFKDVTKLDIMQRTLSGQVNSQVLDSFFDHAGKISTDLDRLGTLVNVNPDQAARIILMKELLTKKIMLFEQYVKLNRDFKGNDTLGNQVRRLTTFINKESAISQPESSKLLKEVKSVTTTTVTREDTIPPEKRNFWDKLWGRKKEQPTVEPTVTQQTREEKLIAVDTQLLKEDNKAISRFGASISQIESKRSAQLRQLNAKRLQLDTAGTLLINQFLLTLNEIESAAKIDNYNNNKEAADIIESGLQTNRVLLISFVILSIVLAGLIFNDIARSNRYRKALILAKEDADEAGRIKQRFLSNMSHEIRTPLQSIIGYTELVQREEDTQNQRKFLGVVHQSSLHLLHIVNEILDFNRINSDKFVITCKPFNLLSVVEQVVDIIAIQAQRKNLVFEKNIELSEQSRTVYGDPFRLKQILLNLLNNAVKFTNTGSIGLKITETNAGDKAHFTFEVRDTGIGISQPDQDRIFNEFEQAPTEQLSQGSGLGLSIVKALVELQGGSIKVNSMPNAGSTFSVFIPYTLNDSGQAATEHNQNALVKAPPRLVWVIDDDSFILELCAEVLKKHNIAYKLFYSAKDLLEEPVPELLSHVLMDIRMPEYSGMELVKMMKVKVRNAQEVQFVALTAQVLPEEVGDIFAAGFDALVRKPFVVEELLFTIGIALPDPVLKPERPPVLEVDHIMDLFKKETRADIDLIQTHNRAAEAQQLSEIFHKLASRLSQLGYTTEGRQARIQELQLRKGQYDEQAINELLQDIARLLQS